MTHEERAAKLDEFATHHRLSDGSCPPWCPGCKFLRALAEQFREVEQEAIPENFLMEQQEQRAELLDKLRAIVSAGDALKRIVLKTEYDYEDRAMIAWDEATKRVERG